MPKHKVTLKAQVMIPATVEFAVEFDTDDGTAQLVTKGRVTSHAEDVGRRTLEETFSREHVDQMAYGALVLNGTLPVPGNEELVISGQRIQHTCGLGLHPTSTPFQETQTERRSRIAQHSEAEGCVVIAARDMFVYDALDNTTNKQGELCLVADDLKEVEPVKPTAARP